MPSTLHYLAMHRAVELLGGPDALAALLEVSPRVVNRWMNGTLDIPQRVFLRVVDIVLEKEICALQTNALPRADSGQAKTTSA